MISDTTLKVPWVLLLNPDGSTLFEKEVNYDRTIWVFNPINIAMSNSLITILGDIYAFTGVLSPMVCVFTYDRGLN